MLLLVSLDSFSWDARAYASGSKYSFQSKAYDAAGNIGESSISTITVDNTRPNIAITSPVSNSAVAKGATLTIKATASDNAAVSKVEFYVSNVWKCSDNISPYTCAWKVPYTNTSSYPLNAKAYDTAGNIATSQTVSVVVR